MSGRIIAAAVTLLSSKYDLTKHPNYYLTGDCDKKNLFDIEKFLSRQMKLMPDDRYDVVHIG